MAGLQSRNRPSTAPIVGAGYRITDMGNTTMKVVVRIRPENDAEASSGVAMVTRVLDSHVLVFDPQPENIPIFPTLQKPLNPFRRRGPLLGRKHKDLRFAFDRVFDETATQQEVFEESTKNIVESVLDGINCSVFAYGATGAGKTHTMLGSVDCPGVMFHTMMELYRHITQLRDNKTFQVIVSYCEVYNETIRDLLSCSLDDGGSLELREDPKNGLVVSNLSKHQPQTAEGILGILERGNMNRTQHPTDANATSSRSHAVFQVYVHQKPRTAAISSQMTCAKLSLIDLAGSERATVTTNRGARLREGANINKSLLALGNCINALADHKAKSVHVPYRNSKLTRLLKDSLGGNCRTVMIANISPSGLTFEDTYNTLKYADRAKQIKTKVVRNVLNVDFHVSRYRAIVQDLQKEIAELKAKLETRTPGKRSADSSSESSRLQDLVRGVYGERSKLRKHMVDMDTQERETLLRICRKERDLHRIDTLTGNEPKKAKLSAKVSSLQQQIVDIERQKQLVHEFLFSNNEAITRVQKEIKTTTSATPGMHDLMREVVEGRKMATENAHHWRQTKHLLRYIKAQEREIGKTERVLLLALEVARKQHSLLRAHNALTASVRDMFSNLVHAAEGEKGVAWADQDGSGGGGDGETLPDVTGGGGGASFSMCRQALFDTFLVHASPARRLSLDKHSPATFSKPVAGILSKCGGAGGSQETSGGSSVTRDPSPSETSLSVLSSVLSSRASSIPDKPRMPTPIDDLSSSCSSNNSMYDTRLNTVINSYHQKPMPAVMRAGRYIKKPTNHGGTPHDSTLDTPRGTPEPYLTPLPSLHKLTLTRQNSERLLAGESRPVFSAGSAFSTTRVGMSSPTGTASRAVTTPELAAGKSRVTTANTTSRNFKLKTPVMQPPTTPPLSSTQPTSAFTKLLSKATRLQSAPIPPLRPPHNANSTLPQLPPRATPFSKPALSTSKWGRFEDNFVSMHNTYTPPPSRSPPNLPPRGLPSSRSSKSPQTEHDSSQEASIASSQEASASSTSTLKSTEPSHNLPTTLLCKPFPSSSSNSSSPVVTVQTHSTTVNLHPTSCSRGLPNANHSVTIGVNQSHTQEESLARPRPPAFIPPPSFDSIHRQTHTVSTTTKCTSTTTMSSQQHFREAQAPDSKHTSKSATSEVEETELPSDADELESPLNSTFTVGTGKSHHRLLSVPYPPHSGGGKTRPNSSKPVPGALKPLHVNAPAALDERGRLSTTATTRKTPSYLQLTKSAASKRVLKQNQENGSGTKKMARGKAFRSVGVSGRTQTIAQPAW